MEDSDAAVAYDKAVVVVTGEAAESNVVVDGDDLPEMFKSLRERRTSEEGRVVQMR